MSVNCMFIFDANLKLFFFLPFHSYLEKYWKQGFSDGTSLVLGLWFRGSKINIHGLLYVLSCILHFYKKKKSQPIKLGFIHAWCIFSFWVWGDKIFDSHVLLEDCNVEETCNVYYNYVSEIVLFQKHNFSLLLFHWEQKSLFSSVRGRVPNYSEVSIFVPYSQGVDGLSTALCG